MMTVVDHLHIPSARGHRLRRNAPLSRLARLANIVQTPSPYLLAAMPSNSAAWIVSKQANPLEVKEAPYPTPEAHEVVVRVHAVAINPVDWLIQDYAPFPMQYPMVLGEDAAGEVVEVGQGVNTLKKGDRVLAHSLALKTGKPANGSFQEYAVFSEFLAAKIPSSLSFEQATVVPLGFSTAACALYLEDFLGLKPPQIGGKPSSADAQDVVIIWGGSSSVGANAIQLAVASGYQVITTASPANFDFVKSLGATTAINYTSKTIVDDLQAATNGKTIHGAFDCICKHGSVETLAKVLSQSTEQGTKRFIATVLPPPKDLAEGVKAADFMATRIGDDENEKLARQLYGEFLTQSLEKGSYKAVPEAHVVGNGLESIQKGLDVQRKGVSAKKVVVTL